MDSVSQPVCFEGLAEHLPQIVLVAQQDGKIEYANRQLERISGYRRDDIGDKHWVKALVAASHREDVLGCLDRAFLGERIESLAFEARHRSKGTFAALAQIHLSDHERHENKAIVIIHDHSQHRFYKEGRRRLAWAVEQSIDGIAITDRDGVIEYCNTTWERMHQLETNGANGLSLSVFRENKRTENSSAPLIEQLKRAGGAFNGEMRHVRVDGSSFPVMLSISALNDEENNGIGFVAIIRDISEQKRIADELNVHRKHLEELVKEKTRSLREAQADLLEASRKSGMAEVSAGVLHNVGNALNSVNVSAQIIEEKTRALPIDRLSKALAALVQTKESRPGTIDPDEMERKLLSYLGNVSESLKWHRDELMDVVGRLGMSVDHIKNVVMLQQSYARHGGVIENIYLHEVVEHAIQINESGLQRHGIVLERDFRDVPEVSADRQKVLQIVVNLLSNAKYACDGCDRDEKRIIVRVYRGPEDTVSVEVEDNGVGIAAENLQKIFNFGFTTRREGHGFGLHSSANTAQQMKGSLIASSEGPNKGARFLLTIPLG